MEKGTPLSQIHNSEEILLELYTRGSLSQKDHNRIRDSIRADHEEAIRLARKEGEDKLKEIREEIGEEMMNKAPGNYHDAILHCLKVINKHLNGERKE